MPIVNAAQQRCSPLRYSAYGLEFSSEVQLPGLRPAKSGRDGQIRFGSIDDAPDDLAAEKTGFRVVDGRVYFYYSDLGTARISQGREMVIELLPMHHEEDLRTFVTGPGLATFLYQRGFLVLHASSVAIGGVAVGFLGGQGWGKSTVAMALHARGHRLVSDDLLVLEPGSDRLLVRPGFPQLKVWPETATMLGVDPTRLPRLHPNLEKRAHRLAEGFQEHQLPLRALYVLAEGELRIDPLDPSESVVELVRHSFFARRLGTFGHTAANFVQCTRLAPRIPIRRLQRPRELTRLPELVSLIERDLGTTAL